jgi:hypothetical protein
LKNHAIQIIVTFANYCSVMENLHEYVYSDAVLNFVKQAGHFTAFLQEEGDVERKDFVEGLLAVMPAMYSAIISVPSTDPVYEGGNERFVSEEEWSAVYLRILRVMGSQNEYLDIPEEDEYDRMELISREISEDLADIYQDVKDFTELFRNGTDELMNDALWECRLNFETYWGKKLLRVASALHRILTRDEDTLERMDREWEEQHGREVNTDDWFISKRQKDTGGESDF